MLVGQIRSNGVKKGISFKKWQKIEMVKKARYQIKRPKKITMMIVNKPTITHNGVDVNESEASKVAEK